MKDIKKYFPLLILVLFSLTPILWFIGKGDVLITGLDTNFPLDPLVWFERRLFVWNATINAGLDFSSSTSGLFFHLIQVIPSFLGLPLRTVEILSLIFWFGAVVFSSYVLASVLTPKNIIARVLFVVFYSFNIYLFNTWENIKVANISLVVSLPLFLTILYLYVNRLISVQRLLFYTVIASIFASGSGINPAYFIAVLLGIFVFLIASLVTQARFKETFIGYTLTLSIIFLINSFWILPLASELLFANPVRGLSDLGLANWLNSLSENTSILNVIRFQGAWDWYAKDQFGLPLYIPYSLNYFKNPIFVLFSFGVPFLALVSFVVREKGKVAWYSTFALFLLLGIFLATGSHEPTGSVYRFLVERLPFFSFFRSPWYIFTPYLIIGFAGLISLLYENLAERFNKLRFFYLFAIILAIGQLVYSYPLISGKIFRPGRYDSFYVKFPEYIWEAKNFLDKNKEGEAYRIVAYPDDQLETFSWGYRGTESILGLFSSREFITPSFNFTNYELGLLLDRFYLDIKRGDYRSAFRSLPFLGADTVFTKNDTSSLSRKIKVDASEITDISDKTDIGAWSFLKYKGPKASRFFSPEQIYINLTGADTFASLAKTLKPQTIVVNPADSEVVKIRELDKKSGHLIKTTRKTPDSPVSNIQEHSFTISKDGLYGFYLEVKDSKGGNMNLDGVTLVVDEATEIRSSETSEAGFIKFGPVNLATGDHYLKAQFPPPENLIKIEDYSNFGDFKSLRKDELPQNSRKTLVVFDQNGENKHFLIPIDDFDPFFRYELSFDYKYFYGNVPILDIIQSAATAPVQTYPRYVGSSQDWEHKSFIIDPVKVDSKIEVFVKPGSNLGSRSKTFIEDIKFTRIYDNELLVKSESPGQIMSPPILYKRVSPTGYLVQTEAKEPFFLIFLENYHPGWVVESNSLEAKPFHFTANGYANAWYIQPKEEKQVFKVIYKPQLYYRAGMLASLITATVSAVLFLYDIGRTRKYE